MLSVDDLPVLSALSVIVGSARNYQVAVLTAHVDDWTELTTLAEALVEAFGEPPTGQSAAEATSDALRTMEAQGIVAIADPVTESVPSQSI